MLFNLSIFIINGISLLYIKNYNNSSNILKKNSRFSYCYTYIITEFAC